MTKRHYKELQEASTQLCRALHHLYLVSHEASLPLELTVLLDMAIESCITADEQVCAVSKRFSSSFNSESYSDKALQS